MPSRSARARLHPPAKPRLPPASITRTSGRSMRTRSATPSVDPFSTMTTSSAVAGHSLLRRLWRHETVSSPPLWLTTTTRTRGRSGFDSLVLRGRHAAGTVTGWVGTQDGQLLGEHTGAGVEPGQLPGEVDDDQQEQGDGPEEERARRVSDAEPRRDPVEQPGEGGQ